MKRYEAVTDIRLTQRTPVIMRFDMVAGHTFTRGMVKPFDEVYMKTMQDTMLNLCKEIPGCVFGYTQSDEITPVLVDYQTLESEGWYDYRLEKLCSVGASKAARFFNKYFIHNAAELVEDEDYFKKLTKKFHTADFDCRVFNLPKEEVTNCVVWRQKDAEKNSVQSLAQTLFSQKELNGIKCKELQNKMFTERGVNWNELETPKKRGTACRRFNKKWELDLDMPIVTEDRDYVEKLIYFD
jgi:tRNA(His) 5'-end guanylyltransferase